MSEDEYRNKKTMLFLRKDLYEKLVVMENLCCITRTDGERSNSYFSKKRKPSERVEHNNFEKII
jgi:hypothetical protein